MNSSPITQTIINDIKDELEDLKLDRDRDSNPNPEPVNQALASIRTDMQRSSSRGADVDLFAGSTHHRVIAPKHP